MKKLISLSLGIIMIMTTFFCLPFCVWADDKGSLNTIVNPLFSNGTPYKVNSKFKASKEEKQVALKLRDAMVARNNSFEFEYSSDIESLSKLEDYFNNFFYYAISDENSVSCVDGDYLAHEWYTVNSDYVYENNNGQYVIVMYISYMSDAEDEYKVDKVVKDFLSGIDRSSMSDYEVLKEIHDYILDKCEYNYDDMDDLNNYISAGVFIEEKAVCQGYALAFYRLCKELGFSVRYVSSDPNEGCHAWNLVYIGDAYYYVDTTWDDELDDKYDLFLVDYETLQRYDSSLKEHKLYAEEFDNDDYFNTKYRPYISETVYDSTSKSISNCIVDVNYENPLNTVVIDSQGNTLNYGEDYTITYPDNSYIKIAGMGDYENTETERMLTIDGMTPNMEYTVTQYTGDDMQAPKASLQGLTYGTDYIISYPAYDGAGEYYSVIQGVGKYTGVIFAKYQIDPIDINTLGVSLSYTTAFYNGKPQQPKAVFTGAPGEVEYYIEEEPQTEIGVYPITIVGEGSYTGTVILSYEIRVGTMNDFNISLSTDSFIYDGRAKEPKVFVGSLLENRDYSVYYGDNVSTGVASVTVAGMGYYEGARTVYFYILPQQTRAEVLSTTSSSATVKWRGVADVSGYRIEIYDINGWRDAGDVGADQTTFTVSGLQSYTAYRFRVTPYKLSRGQTVYGYSSNEASTLTDYVAPPQNNETTSNSSSSPSSSSSSSSSKTTTTTTTTSKVSKPKKPTISKLKTSKKTITVYWKKMTASGFQIQYSTSSSFKKPKTVTVKGSSKTSAKIKSLKKGKKYYVRVRAYKTVNGKKYYGSWSAKKSITVK
ncbi:MAG: fibronectin type III domain-containing protein [Eubacterium sp.]